ncbi:MAG: hypothetical protein JRN45_00540 [Nitrososphaerota archaeon]|nr:hypothetical protein [Nitrososphaerota archaeon]
MMVAETQGKYCVYLKREGVIAGIGGVNETLALLDKYKASGPVVVDSDPILEQIWQEDKAGASKVVCDKVRVALLGPLVKEQLKEYGEPHARFKTTLERVVYLLEKNPMIDDPVPGEGRKVSPFRDAHRQSQVDSFRAFFGFTSSHGFSGETVRRTIDYVLNTLRWYPVDDEVKMWQIWNEAQFREFFSAKNAEQFREFAEKGAEIASSSAKDVLSQLLPAESVEIEEDGRMGLVVRLTRYVPDREFTKIRKACVMAGLAYEMGARRFTQAQRAPLAADSSVL